MLPHALEDEDALEMLNAGVRQILVVDDWKAAIVDSTRRIQLHFPLPDLLQH
ncbi:hypothetical protein CBM2589_A10215 [Cupriavidus taiwanensis]|uniref:Uncharacterized protein n=1 Tax=Cupriavidus taiwanensis TaxID=164546 RepID=A0A375BYV2_9BURK|nr:hypothetical protein CBM2589_A10215 [Cupriavidus taiwanensis]